MDGTKAWPLDDRMANDWTRKLEWFKNNPQALIYGDRTIEVKAEHLTKMLTYGKSARNTSRWLTMDSIVAFGKAFETNEQRVLHNQELQKFMKKPVIDKKWISYCKELQTCKNIFMPLLTGDHWMLANIEPIANRLTFFDSLNKEITSAESRLTLAMYEKFLFFFIRSGLIRVGFTVLRDAPAYK